MQGIKGIKRSIVIPDNELIDLGTVVISENLSLDSTFGNNYLEIFKRVHSKPEFNQSLALISSTKNAKVKLLSSTEIDHEWLLNYLKKINFSKYKNLEFLDFNELSTDIHVWHLCYFLL